MERFDKILLIAVLLMIVTLVASNYHNITGQVTEMSKITYETEVSIYGNEITSKVTAEGDNLTELQDAVDKTTDSIYKNNIKTIVVLTVSIILIIIVTMLAVEKSKKKLWSIIATGVRKVKEIMVDVSKHKAKVKIKL